MQYQQHPSPTSALPLSHTHTLTHKQLRAGPLVHKAADHKYCPQVAMQRSRRIKRVVSSPITQIKFQLGSVIYELPLPFLSQHCRCRVWGNTPAIFVVRCTNFAAGDKSGTSLTLPKEAVQPVMASITTPQESGSLVNLWLPQALQGGQVKHRRCGWEMASPPIPKKGARAHYCMGVCGLG